MDHYPERRLVLFEIILELSHQAGFEPGSQQV